jgi:DNA-directed RNA polymerase specialized sigma24 family protein
MDVALTHYPMLLRHARSLTRDDPEDLVQDVFVTLCERPPAAVNQTYLRAAVRLRLVDRLRRDACHAPTALPLEEWFPAPGDVADEATTAVALDRALAALEAHPWGDILFAHAAGRPPVAIAAARGISPATVQTRIHRLRHGPLARLSPYR